MVIRHQFPTFEWIDFIQSNPQEIKRETNTLALEETWIEDSLEKGHLPKYEKRGNIHFLILRAHAEDTPLRESTVDGISNKLAFLLHENWLITIHRTPFTFLENPPQAAKSSDFQKAFGTHPTCHSTMGTKRTFKNKRTKH